MIKSILVLTLFIFLPTYLAFKSFHKERIEFLALNQILPQASSKAPQKTDTQQDKFKWGPDRNQTPATSSSAKSQPVVIKVIAPPATSEMNPILIKGPSLKNRKPATTNVRNLSTKRSVQPGKVPKLNLYREAKGELSAGR